VILVGEDVPELGAGGVAVRCDVGRRSGEGQGATARLACGDIAVHIHSDPDGPGHLHLLVCGVRQAFGDAVAMVVPLTNWLDLPLDLPSDQLRVVDHVDADMLPTDQWQRHSPVALATFTPHLRVPIVGHSDWTNQHSRELVRLLEAADAAGAQRRARLLAWYWLDRIRTARVVRVGHVVDGGGCS
jgi:hypothetical protein